MSAIYTAVPPPSAEQLIKFAKSNEGQVYGSNRCTLGRKAIEELVAYLAPPSYKPFANAILEKDLWGFLTPAATRGNHIAALQRANPELAVPSPVWPPSTEFACLLGVEPARYIGNNLVLLPADLVWSGVEAFEEHADANEVAAYLLEFLRRTRAAKQAILLHWDHR